MSHLTLIILAELLRDLSQPINREDSDRVRQDLKLILTSEGDLVTRNLWTHTRLFRKKQVGRGKFSALMVFDEAFGEWENRTGDCRPPALSPPGRGLAEDNTPVSAVTETTLQNAWDGIKQRKLGKPDLMSPWYWMSPRKEWTLVRSLVDKLKLPKYGWETVNNYWCPHQK
jgi:hypothetical protein